MDQRFAFSFTDSFEEWDAERERWEQCESRVSEDGEGERISLEEHELEYFEIRAKMLEYLGLDHEDV